MIMILLASPHVLRAHMGHTCGEPNEIGLTAAHGLSNRSFSGLFRDPRKRLVSGWNHDKHGMVSGGLSVAVLLYAP